MKNMVNEQQYNDLLTKSEFEAALRKIGKERYHDNCRFHHLLHNGLLNKVKYRHGLLTDITTKLIFQLKILL